MRRRLRRGEHGRVAGGGRLAGRDAGHVGGAGFEPQQPRHAVQLRPGRGEAAEEDGALGLQAAEDLLLIVLHEGGQVLPVTNDSLHVDSHLHTAIMILTRVDSDACI